MPTKITPASQASPAELQDLLSALRRTSLFQHVSPEDLFRVALDMDRVAFQPGDILGPKEGEPQDAMFVVTTGRLVRRTGRGRRMHEGSEEPRPLSEQEAEEMTQPLQSSSNKSGETNIATATAEETSSELSIQVRATADDNQSTISIMCPDRPGLVGSVASIMAQQGLSIQNSTIKTTKAAGKKAKLSSKSTDASDESKDTTQDVNNFLLHTAYQVHDVVDAKTLRPVSDAGRMRVIEAAVRRDLEDFHYYNDNEDDEGSQSKDAKWKKARGAKRGYVAATIVGSCRNMQAGGLTAFGTLHVLGQLPAVATTYAVTSGVCWRLSSKALEKLIATGNSESLQHIGGDADVTRRPTLRSRFGIGKHKNTHVGRKPPGELESSFAVDIASGLAAEVYRLSNSYSTPLFEQPAQKVNIAAVSVAAVVEAYYRSALNSFLNAAIQSTMSNSKASGAPIAMFPDMHVQIPIRVLYINGFKLSRQWLSELVEEPLAAATAKGDERRQDLLNLIPALAPGVLMTPMSSVLEACNAGHSNSEPLYRRWIRGVVPRCGREIIFGLGLNNLTDYAEERIPRDVCEGKAMRNALGSLCAGVISGYFSHVPHNLSTMKLLQPNVSYAAHVASLIEASKSRVPATLPPPTRHMAATALALLWPKGLEIRTTQVVGSFILLNGISHLLDQGK